MLCLGFLLTAGTAAPISAEAQSGRIEAIPGGDDMFDLTACIDAALVANAGLQAQEAKRGELQGQMTQARATGLPTIDLTGSWLRSRDPSFALNPAFDSGDDSGGEGDASPFDSLFDPANTRAATYWRSSINAHWNLNPFLVFNAIGAAGLGIARQETVIDDATHRMIEQVITGYYGIISTSALVEALDADITARNEFLDVTRRRFNLGLATSLDTLRAAVSAANLIPERRSAVQRLRDAGSNLNVLMGRAPFVPLAVTGEITIENDTIDAEAAEARVAARPDIAQIDLLINILRKNRGAQKAGHRPSFSADASYGYVGTDLNSMTDDGHDFWNASVSVNIPIFDGLNTKGLVEETEAMIRKMGYDREEAQRRARLEIRSLIGDLETARENLKVAQMNLAAADDALEQITFSYDLGKAEYLAVLNTQSDRFLASNNFILARHNLLTLTASLKRALGYNPRESLREINSRLAAEKK
jgi:outer membrane protein TolC